MHELLKKVNYNPDVLTCLANLSNDEVFTPPAIANQVLDLLPSTVWSDKTCTFLDPATKSGVFLREIAKRLMDGLRDEFPDNQERANHIFKNQLFGLAITELTGLLSRRSIYCTKQADNEYSVCSVFEDSCGNVHHNPTQHSWQADGKCKYCRANRKQFDRNDALEAHAYQFIHTDNPKEIFEMKFDVIVGNPPYQLNVGVQKENYAIALYHEFVENALKLDPRFLCMIIPARWYAGGRGLGKFRDKMLSDRRMRVLVDYPNAADCFPGVDISGGVCFFLWDRDNQGDCEVRSVKGQEVTSSMVRPLLEPDCDTFIRYNPAIPIVEKVASHQEKKFDEYVSPQTPFGLVSSFKDFRKKPFSKSVKLFSSSGIGYLDLNDIPRNKQWVSEWKVYIAKSYGERGQFPYFFLGKPFLGEPGTCCTQSYLVLGPFPSKAQAENVMDYIRTRFFRFCIMLKRNTQDAMRHVYSMVPVQDFSESWTDEKLFKKYGLSPEEIAFIEAMVRPMGENNG